LKPARFGELWGKNHSSERQWSLGNGFRIRGGEGYTALTLKSFKEGRAYCDARVKEGKESERVTRGLTKGGTACLRKGKGRIKASLLYQENKMENSGRDP